MVEKKGSLEVVDWQESLRLTSGDEVVARKLLTMFVDYLDKFTIDIKQNLANKDYEAVARNVHKLHGAACYTGVPELKKLAASADKKFSGRKAPLPPSKIKDTLEPLYSAIDKVKIEANRLTEIAD